MKKKLEIMLHPVRMRILQTLLNGKRKTPQQMKQLLGDVTQPTLYRHIQTLLEHQLIEVVEENQRRGTVEKVYALRHAAVFSKSELEQATKEDHGDFFLMFVTNLLNQFQAYLAEENADPRKDNVSYRQVQLRLTDEEFVQFYEQMGDVIGEYIDNEAISDRKLYTISTVIIPNESS